MSDTAVTTNQTAPSANPDGMLLDGEAPRLGSTPIMPPAPMGGVGTPVTPEPVTTSTEVPVTPDAPRFATDAPAIPAAEMPKLPTAAPATPPTAESDDGDKSPDLDAESQHPMAHLMPPKSKPTEASIRAAEQRAIKRAKAKKIKIGVAVGALVIAALAGPPLVSWLTNAINESGSLNTEEPVD